MSNCRATYEGEELTVRFTATISTDWEGDFRVPNGAREVDDISDIEIDRVDILGIEVDPAVLPKKPQDEILALAEGLTFEQDEPEYEEADYE